MLRRAFLAALAVALLSTLATAQQQPAPAATPGDASKLAKRIAKRYRIAPVAAVLVVETARQTFPEDPTLLLVLACVASSLRPFADSGHGEIGLTQVRPELHGYSPAWLIDPRGSLEAGAHGLRSCIARAGGDVPRGLAF